MHTDGKIQITHCMQMNARARSGDTVELTHARNDRI